MFIQHTTFIYQKFLTKLHTTIQFPINFQGFIFNIIFLNMSLSITFHAIIIIQTLTGINNIPFITYHRHFHL